MIIAFEAKWLNKKKVGMDYYFHGLINALIKLYPDCRFKLYAKSQLINRKIKNLEYKQAIMPGRLMNVIWDNFSILPMEKFVGDFDIYHSPILYMPYVKSHPKIMTIHDLSFLRHSNIFDKKRQKHNTLHVKYAKRANHIIADSHSTKNDIIEFLKMSPEKISVVHLGYNSNIYHKSNNEKKFNYLLDHYKLRKNFFLFVGTIEPRKNISNLIKAFELFYLQVDKCIDLVLIGGKGWLCEDVFRRYNHSVAKENIKFLGYIPINDMKYFYSACIGFVYPSFYEGFGLPPLEAMACGAPVITSNVSSLPEVVGDTAFQIDPNSEIEIFEKLKLLYSDSNTRQELSKNGLLRAQRFSWEKCARETMEVYLKLC